MSALLFSHRLRGDGFPLASMLAMLSVDNKDLVPVLTAHVYTVCPTAMPTLPNPSKDVSEDVLMESLGMSKDKKGEYETFEKFLSRTEVCFQRIVKPMVEWHSKSQNTHFLDGFLHYLAGFYIASCWHNVIKSTNAYFIWG